MKYVKVVTKFSQNDRKSNDETFKNIWGQENQTVIHQNTGNNNQTFVLRIASPVIMWLWGPTLIIVPLQRFTSASNWSLQ